MKCPECKKTLEISDCSCHHDTKLIGAIMETIRCMTYYKFYCSKCLIDITKTEVKYYTQLDNNEHSTILGE